MLSLSDINRLTNSRDGYGFADHIEQLEAENARLREALQWYAKDYDYEHKSSQWDGGCIARQALGDKTND